MHDPGQTIATARGEVLIRAVREEDLAAYRDLRLEALRLHPTAFGADYEEQRRQPESFWVDRIRSGSGADAGITYLAATGATLVGMTGIVRDGSSKTGHTGIIWGVYIRQEWRGLGIINELIRRCLSWAGSAGLRWARLAVATNNVAAISSYDRAGFTVFGLQPEAILVDGIYYDELLMARRVRQPAPGDA